MCHNYLPFQSSPPVFSGICVAHSLVFCSVLCLSLSLFNLRLLITHLVSSNFWPLYCMSFFNLWLLMTPLVFSNVWPLYCLSFNLRLLITTLVSSNFWPLHCLSVLQFKTSDYPFGIFKLLAIVLSILPSKTSDYPCGVFKLFLVVERWKELIA